ncbi:MAG: bifunctional DNA-formamidopyrimidine glycosylase/DNA-(apurinic or apyrimidinic site) lyase [Neomegalonema sp.]|nr:bifunctional DNA-formamidopyrimidine glycosylase/DNA-(apurinic or apyrimidinic site) lyase [Neomegalonema sp.]
MPELPEVETVRRGLEPALAGRRIQWARAFRRDLRWPLPDRFAERLEGAFIRALSRRSKYLLIELERPEGGDGETWISHLGMSGRFIVSAHGDERGDGATATVPGNFALGHNEAAARRGAHDHVMLATEAGLVVYNDPRRFGAMDLWPTSEIDAHPSLAKLGPEPLSDAFSAESLAAGLAGRRAPIKSLLLDQTLVAGLGNIYVCEALWRAGVSPFRAAGALSATDAARLADDVKLVLQEAIAAGGSSLRDYRQADGALGYFQHAFAVYDRAGLPCKRPGCGGEVLRATQSGRSSFYCPRCQI